MIALAPIDKALVQKTFATIRYLEKNECNMPFVVAGFVWEFSGLIVLDDKGSLKVSSRYETKIKPVMLDEYTIEQTKKLLKVFNEDLFSTLAFE